MLQSIVLRTATLSLRGLALSCVLLGSAFAAEPVTADPVKFEIEPQPLGSALNEFARQSDRELLFATEVVENKEAQLVVGVYEPEAALEFLLADTGLEYSVTGNDTFLVDEAEDPGNAWTTPRPVTMAQASREGDRTSQEPTERKESERESERAKWPIEEIVVTGTNIRGIAPESSPVRTFTREDIEISGAATAQDFLQTLPQNFGGGSNADLSFGTPNDVNSSFNGISGGTLGSSVNLRGLGSGGTLILLNGHRLAPSSGIGDFVDISMIPASAIERIDILTDGASSIYGADAVAGVVNFILRDDFDGAEASVRYGTVTEGGLGEYRAGLTIGKNWNTGHALVVYEYFNQDSLSAADRSFSQGAPLPTDLLPSQRRHSVLGSVSQELTGNFEVFADILYSNRVSERNGTFLGGDIFQQTPSSENLNISAGGSLKLAETWFVDFSGTLSDLHGVNEVSSVTSSALRELDSRIWTADAKISGNILNLPGGEAKIALGGHYRSESFSNFNSLTDSLSRGAKRDVYALFGEAYIPVIGPDNSIPGVERFEINVSGRFEDYTDFGSTANPKVGVLWSPAEPWKVRGSFSTSFNPPPLGRVGATDTVVTALSTSFINSTLGFTPADPAIEDVVVLSVFGTGTDLDAENSRAFTAGLDYNEQWGRHDIVVSITWFDIEFENRLGTLPCPGCTNNNVLDAPNVAFNSPELFPVGTVIFSPSQTEISNFLDSSDGLVALEDPLDAEIINFAGVVRNVARTSVEGLDFDIVYSYESTAGLLSLGINGTYVDNFEQQGSDVSPSTDQVDTLFNPVSLRLRSRAGYAHNGFALNTFVNYLDGYRVDNTPGATTIDSWTTVDLSISFETRERFHNVLVDNSTVRLSVINLFDENPPSTPSNPQFQIFGFDPANATPLNRFISIELTKAF